MSCDIFLSYSRADLAMAQRLEAALAAGGLIVWRDQNAVRPGGSFPDDIAEAILSCFAVVWLASSSSVKSAWVRRELAFATDQIKLIIPVHLNREALDQMPPGLRLLFPHIDHARLDVDDFAQGSQAILQSLREAGVRAGRLSLAESFATHGAIQPTGLAAIPPAAASDLLPIDEQSPLVLGVAVDVSGSMQAALAAGGEGRNRLEGALHAIRDLASRYRQTGAPPEVAASMGLAKLFAYGFGFADRAAKYGKLGALAQRFLKDAPPVPARIFSGAVRDLLEMAGTQPHTLSLREVDQRWLQIEERLWEQRIDLFGTTHMRAAMESVARRFATEFARYDGTPHSALFLISDGESKDGSPVEVARQIAQQGTIILSCYLTGQDVADPRKLYESPLPNWPEGAITLFECASALEEDSILLPVLRDKGWQAREGDRLFVQLNQSALLVEFGSVVLDLVPYPR